MITNPLPWAGLLALLAGAMTGHGAALWRRQLWLGVATTLLGLMALGALLATAWLQVGIGSTLLRVSLTRLLLPAVMLFAVGTLLGLVITVNRPATRRAGLLPLLFAPLFATGLWGLITLATPPRERERVPERRAIVLPAGFDAQIYLRGGIDNPTAITFGTGRDLYVSDIAGDLWLARDRDGDLKPEPLIKAAGGFDLLVGVLWHNGELVVASAGKIEALRDADGDGVFELRRTLADGLPALIRRPHSNNGLALGPDGRIYFGVGSTLLRGVERVEFAGSISSVSPDGGDARVFARGFGNVYDVAFNRKGQLFAGDNAGTISDETQEQDPPDELNLIEAGKDYGNGSIAGSDDERANITPPLIEFVPHATPTGLTFYSARVYPEKFWDAGFLTLWNRGELLLFDPAAPPASRASVFGRGFLYPIDVTTGPDGSLYMADFGTSVIYRIVYAP